MTKINIITPPDNLFNNNFTLLLIGTRASLLTEMQNDILPKLECDLNIYYYDKSAYNKNEIDWLLSAFKMSDLVIYDIDNCSVEVRNLSSYFIAESKTYWLTNDINPVYNHISTNRIYNLQFLLEDGGKIGKKAY